MNLNQISKDIVAEIQFREKFEGENFESLSKKVEKILKEQVVNILEPEGVYEMEKYYDGLGTYVGIFNTYPWNCDYIKIQHRFIENNNSKDRDATAKINEILIREIQK